MNITNVKKAIPYLFDAELTPFLWGVQGVGKTTVIRQVAREQGYGLVVLHLGQMADAGDLIGLPEIIKETNVHTLKSNDGKRKGYTVFMPPEWVPTEGKWIIFFDELNRARRDIIQAVFQLILERRNHSVELPTETRCIAAGNPNNENFITTDISDDAFTDRFCHIKFEPSFQEWVDYATASGFSKELVTFLKQQPQMLGEVSVDHGLTVKPSPRTNEFISRLDKMKIEDDLFTEIVTGCAGPAFATAFMESKRAADQPIPYTDVLNNFQKIEVKLKKYCDKETVRQDLLQVTVNDLINEVHKNTELTDEQADNILKLLKLMPVELTYKMSREVVIANKLMNKMAEDKEYMQRINEEVAPLKAKIKEEERVAAEAKAKSEGKEEATAVDANDDSDVDDDA